MGTSSSKSGPDPAAMNAPLPAQPSRSKVAAGASGRDAGQSAGVVSGLSEKSTFHNTAVEQLGKPIAPMGTPPWDTTPSESMGGGHSFKNG
jgi:hypothetical protein